MLVSANVAGGLVGISATVANKHVGVLLVFVGLGILITGLAMLPLSPSI